MFNLILHYIIYGLFEVYLFTSYWFLRITFLDHVVEKLAILLATKTKVRVDLAYKRKKDGSQEVYDAVNNGDDPDDKWPTITVHDRRVFAKMAAYPTLGLGEAFIDGWIDADGIEISEAVARSLELDFDYKWARWHPFFRLWNWLLFDCCNNQTKAGVKRLMRVQYDLGNDAFERLIGPTWQYTCAYWRNASNVDEAQMHKMDLIARKLKLQPGMRVLDIGCGWGSLANYLSTKYDVYVTAVNASAESIKHMKEVYKDNNNVEAVLADYRDMAHLGTFDRITGIGVLEHVGHKNYRNFMHICRKQLKDDGILLLHFIAANQSKSSYPRTEAFCDKYVFPCGELPYQHDITKAIRHLFVIEDWHNFGPDYWKTCDAWWHNWVAHKDYIVEKYGVKTYRCFYCWLRYTLNFHYRRWHLWQIVLTKNGIVGGYDSVR